MIRPPGLHPSINDPAPARRQTASPPTEKRGPQQKSLQQINTHSSQALEKRQTGPINDKVLERRELVRTESIIDTTFRTDATIRATTTPK